MRNSLMSVVGNGSSFIPFGEGENGETVFSNRSHRLLFAEVGDSLVIVNHVPGCSKEDIEVSIDRSVVTIKAVGNSIAGLKHNFLSSFTLGDAIIRDYDLTTLNAVCSKGALTLTLQRKESSKKRDVEVS